jgi:hypothetical protein
MWGDKLAIMRLPSESAVTGTGTASTARSYGTARRQLRKSLRSRLPGQSPTSSSSHRAAFRSRCIPSGLASAANCARRIAMGVQVRGGTRQLRTCPRSLVSWCWEQGNDRAGGSVDPADHDRLRGTAGGDRRDGVVSAYAFTGRAARSAGLGRGADTAVSGRNDRRGVDDAAGRVAVRAAWRVPPVGAAGCRQCGEPGRERGGRGADGDGPGDLGVAVVRADRVI